MRQNIEHRNSRGELHNKNGPALVLFYKNGKKWSETYYLNGKCHNENGPADTYWHKNGQKHEELYYICGGLHNENGPAHRRWHKSGEEEYKGYYINGKAHNKTGPAVIYFKKNGQISDRGYYVDDKQLTKEEFCIKYSCKEEGTNTFTEKHPNGEAKRITYKNKEGKPHNTNDSAIIHYDEEGNKILEEHWIHGELLYIRKVFDDKPITTPNGVVMSLLNNRTVMRCLRALVQ
ncbi:MAG: hypothetical protein GY861_02560 [bacterium]|nr:hypothetical protein [bacterium]